MRKILISTLIILLIAVACLTIFKGLSIGNFSVLSAQQISDENDKLTEEILQTELLMYTTFNTKTEELNKSVSNLLAAKQEYLDLANLSSEKEITQASQEETYTVEFLWTRLGRHATAQGVTLKYEIASGTTGESDVKNILFTVGGNYVPIIDFISAIENDSELAFRIENFKMIPGQSALQATFATKNVRIKSEITTNTNKTTEDLDGKSKILQQQVKEQNDDMTKEKNTSNQ